MIEYLIRVHGRVQGVGYRDFTRSAARYLGVSGTVRNLADGGVEIVAQGSRDSLQALVARLEDGPATASVDDLEISERTHADIFQSFEVTSSEY